MRIRTAREDDWKSCLELDVSYETETAWQMEELRGDEEWGVRFREVRLPRKQKITPLLTLDQRQKVWENSDIFWVATEQRQVVGYLALLLGAGRGEARIADLAVGVGVRRQGIASELLWQAADWCLRKDVEHLILECSLKAQPSIGFAMKHRFVFCGYQDAYWPGQEVAVFFRKRLR